MSETVALVTGGSRGIGRAISVALARNGARVAINYLSEADSAKETLSLVEEAGSDGICVRGDVRDPVSVDRGFAEVESGLGAVDILINNAGIRRDGLAVSLSDIEWSDVVASNLSGTFYCCRRSLRHMLAARRGCIVNLSSVAGLHGSPGQIAYAASKGGVIALTKTLAREVGPKGVRVNAVAPGLIETDLTSSLTPAATSRILSQVPAGRPGTTDEVAGLVAFLCTDAASYMNGAVLTVDGGMVA